MSQLPGPRCVRRHRVTHACLEWSDGKGLGGTIRGLFCERKVAAKKRFDRRSFRWKRSGKAWLLIGCPKGSWKAKREHCEVGTRAYAILTPTRGSCPADQRRLRKG